MSSRQQSVARIRDLLGHRKMAEGGIFVLRKGKGWGYGRACWRLCVVGASGVYRNRACRSHSSSSVTSRRMAWAVDLPTSLPGTSTYGTKHFCSGDKWPWSDHWGCSILIVWKQHKNTMLTSNIYHGCYSQTSWFRVYEVCQVLVGWITTSRHLLLSLMIRINSQDLHHEQREPTPSSCHLTFTCMLQHMHHLPSNTENDIRRSIKWEWEPWFC